MHGLGEREKGGRGFSCGGHYRVRSLVDALFLTGRISVDSRRMSEGTRMNTDENGMDTDGGICFARHLNPPCSSVGIRDHHHHYDLARLTIAQSGTTAVAWISNLAR